jgi:four helix bundle protein
MSYKVTNGSNAKRCQTTKSGETGFQTFEDLEVYRVAREFRKTMYAVTRRLPELETYDLASQVRRAAVSLTNNMAEGHGRYHYPDQTRFFLHSRGSLEELMDDVNVCSDENYLPSEEITKLKEQALLVLRLINGYIRYLRCQSVSIREGDDLNAQFTDAPDDLPFNPVPCNL